MSLQVSDFHDDLYIVNNCQSSSVQNDNCFSSLSTDDKMWLASVDLQKNSLVLNVIDDTLSPHQKYCRHQRSKHQDKTI